MNINEIEKEMQIYSLWKVVNKLYEYGWGPHLQSNQKDTTPHVSVNKSQSEVVQKTVGVSNSFRLENLRWNPLKNKFFKDTAENTSITLLTR